MKYKFFVYCPDRKELIDTIITVASQHGAGVYGRYSQVAFITHGEGNWKTENGAHPVEGHIGMVTRSNIAKIEMTCEAKQAKEITSAIKSVHPWEQVDIEFVTVNNI